MVRRQPGYRPNPVLWILFFLQDAASVFVKWRERTKARVRNQPYLTRCFFASGEANDNNLPYLLL
jgi:hypothetical protein